MAKPQDEKFKSYFREFKQLRRDGYILCYPENEEMKPKHLAELIAYDTGATYMRDAAADDKGGAVRIHFNRVEI